MTADGIDKCSACGAEKPIPEKNGNTPLIVAVSVSIAAAVAISVTLLAICKKRKNK